MIPQLASRPFSIENLLSAPFLFLSPSFQRPFSWQVETAERLLGDIQAASSGTPEEIYFLGAVLLVRVPLPGEVGSAALAETTFTGSERTFEIIDGQQRIVTLSILTAVLRDLTDKDGQQISRRLAKALNSAQGKVARVRLRGADNDFLQQCIGVLGACLIAPPVEPASEPQRRIVAIRDFFVRQLSLLPADEVDALARFVLENCAVVAVVTNTIDRAYQMFTVLNDAGEPLTRNDILKAELIGQVAPTERPRATETWEDLELRLGEDFEQLFAFVRAWSGRGSGPIVGAVREQVAALPGGAAAFIFEILAPAGRIVETILKANHKGAPQSAQINDLLRYLNWLPGKEWVPPLLAFWFKHGQNSAQLLAFLVELDRFAYGVRFQGLGVDKRAQRMAATTALIETGKVQTGPWPPLQFNRDELRAIQFSLRDLHKRSPQVCRLVLLRLDEHFGGAPMSNEEPLTVEHILPTKVGADSQWRRDFPDADVRQKLATCMGNLTLVTGPVNEKAANHDFARKITVYFADGQRVSKLTDELRKLRAWTPVQIEDRLTRMNKGLNELWRLE